MTEKGKNTLTLYCNCSYYDFIPDHTREAVLQAMIGAGIEFEAISDLCELCAKHDPVLKKWAEAEKILIIACFPRAIRWLFDSGKAQLSPQNVTFFNMRTTEPEEIISGLLSGQKLEKDVKKPKFEKEDWVPWFPVIDYDRCKNCKQCMNFCLFGVYGLSGESKVEVQNPAHCKTNCPACARICPHSAIIFPKYSDSPINGDEIPEKNLEENASSKLSEALQGNVYDAIRKRSGNREMFSGKKENSSSESSLEKFQERLDIPADVMKSLSPAEIQGILKKSCKDVPDKK